MVGVETTTEAASAIDLYRTQGVSSVDDVETISGRVALALLLAGGTPGHYGVKDSATDGVAPPIDSCRSRVADLTVLIAARNEEERIGETVTALRDEFGDAEILVVDGASTDRTAAEAEAAGAVVLRFAERGKGEALTAGERMVAPGPLLLCDADLRGSLQPLAAGDADLRVAAFTRRVGGGFGSPSASGASSSVCGRASRLTSRSPASAG